MMPIPFESLNGKHSYFYGRLDFIAHGAGVEPQIGGTEGLVINRQIWGNCRVNLCLSADLGNIHACLLNDLLA
jgi:hypothetical protein